MTLIHPRGQGQVSLSLETLGLSNEEGNYLLRCSTRRDSKKTYFDSLDEAIQTYKYETSSYIAQGYFLPLPRNLSDMVDYDKSQKRIDAERATWNTMERMPVDKAFFEGHYIRELYDGHHVLIKLRPSETQPFLMWDGRGTYTLSDTLLSKLSMMHAYIDITGMTLSATLTHSGDVVINDVLLDKSHNNESSQMMIESLRFRAGNTPLRFLRFATSFSTADQWHSRDNKAAYASYRRTSKFADKALRYYFPSGSSYKVMVKSLYELHATSIQGCEEIVLCLSKTPFIFQLDIGESFVADGQRLFTQPMFDNLQFYAP